jgi:hypothetical protein
VNNGAGQNKQSCHGEISAVANVVW